MKKKGPTCIDCRCDAVSHTASRQDRYLMVEEIVFACGASQKETFNSENGTGSVVFSGGACG